MSFKKLHRIEGNNEVYNSFFPSNIDVQRLVDLKKQFFTFKNPEMRAIFNFKDI